MKANKLILISLLLPLTLGCDSNTGSNSARETEGERNVDLEVQTDLESNSTSTSVPGGDDEDSNHPSACQDDDDCGNGKCVDGLVCVHHIADLSDWWISKATSTPRFVVVASRGNGSTEPSVIIQVKPDAPPTVIYENNYSDGYGKIRSLASNKGTVFASFSSGRIFEYSLSSGQSQVFSAMPGFGCLSLAASDDDIFCAGEKDHNLYRIQINNQSTEAIRGGYINDLIVHEGDVYWSDEYSGIGKISLPGAQETMILETDFSDPIRLRAVDRSFAYFQDEFGAILRVSLTGGEPEELVPAQDSYIGQLFVAEINDDYLFSYNFQLTSADIFRTPKDGGDLQRIASSFESSSSQTVGLFWRDSELWCVGNRGVVSLSY